MIRFEKVKKHGWVKDFTWHIPNHHNEHHRRCCYWLVFSHSSIAISQIDGDEVVGYLLITFCHGIRKAKV
jgi:hypothetical protein